MKIRCDKPKFLIAAQVSRSVFQKVLEEMLQCAPVNASKGKKVLMLLAVAVLCSYLLAQQKSRHALKRGRSESKDADELEGVSCRRSVFLHAIFGSLCNLGLQVRMLKKMKLM